MPLALAHHQSADPDFSPGKQSWNLAPLCGGVKCLVRPPELRGGAWPQGGEGLVQGPGGFLSAGQILSQLWPLKVPQINQPRRKKSTTGKVATNVNSVSKLILLRLQTVFYN